MGQTPKEQSWNLGLTGLNPLSVLPDIMDLVKSLSSFRSVGWLDDWIITLLGGSYKLLKVLTDHILWVTTKWGGPYAGWQRFRNRWSPSGSPAMGALSLNPPVDLGLPHTLVTPPWNPTPSGGIWASSLIGLSHSGSTPNAKLTRPLPQ